MKMKFIMTVFVLLAASGLAAAATNDLPALLQRGLFEEEANHQLDAAIVNYKEAIEHFDHERQLAATAIFRLGECYRKLGRTNEAAVQYQRIAREFDGQKELVTLSRQNLTGMGISAAPANSSIPDGARQKQRQLLEEEIKVVEREFQLQQTQFKTGLLTEDATLATQQKLLELKRQLAALEGDQAGSASSIAASPTEASLLPSDEEKFLREVQESVQNSPDLVNQQLITAAKKGYVSAAEFLLAHGANVNLQTPIVEAAIQGNEAMVQLLLSHGAAVNSKDEHGRTALLMAVDEGFMAVCRTLLAHGADVNLQSPIRTAVSQGNEAMVQFLLSHGAAAEFLDNDGRTLLFLAVENESAPVCLTLLAQGADVNAKDKRGSTPLLIAMTRPDTNMVKLLLDSRADANLETSIGTSWHLSPLAWAIYLNRPDLVKLLLEAHADPNALIASRPVFDITSHQVTMERWDMHNRFNHGQSAAEWAINWVEPVPGTTPLLWVTRGNPPQAEEIVKLLLDHGANPNAVDASGRTALRYAIAAVQGSVDEVQTLIAHGADVNALDKEGRPPLAQVKPPLTETGRQIQALLIKAGADVDYNRRLGIWTGDSAGKPKEDIFSCSSNSINHYTLFEFLAESNRREAVKFPDFAHVSIHRLAGKRNEVLPVNVADILQSGDCSKNMALRPGDVVEIPEREHKVAESWNGLSEAEGAALEKCLARTVRIMVKGTTTEAALKFGVDYFHASPGFGRLPAAPPFANLYSGTAIIASGPGAHPQDIKSGTPHVAVKSFHLDAVVHVANVILNTSDLSRVRLTRGSAKIVFDLTANPAPEVWLEDGDVIEIPELGEGAPAADAKETSQDGGPH
jgi:ankyrin repeat protein